LILSYDAAHPRFIERTFRGIFFTPQDLRFLDRACWNVRKLSGAYKQAMAMSALVRSCAKRQPRGVFTVGGDPEQILLLRVGMDLGFGGLGPLFSDGRFEYMPIPENPKNDVFPLPVLLPGFCTVRWHGEPVCAAMISRGSRAL
jgi:hypothetical protein